MRLFLSVMFGAVLLAIPVRADDPVGAEAALAGVPAPLREAVLRVGRDANHWAFTVHTVTRDRKGRITEDIEARYDPSQHYDVQWTLLRTGGKAATEAQVKKFRKERAKLEKDRRPLGELLDLDHARLLAEAPGSPAVLTYVVPIKWEGRVRFPVEKVEVLLRVNAVAGAFDSIELRLREPVRAMLIAKVKSVEAVIRFASVDAKFAPTVTHVTADLGASLALVPVEQHTQQTRTDFKRVTPYDDRFVVKPGPLRTIDF